MKKRVCCTLFLTICSLAFCCAYRFSDQEHRKQEQRYARCWIVYQPLYRSPAVQPEVYATMKGQTQLNHFYNQVGRAWIETTLSCLPFILEPPVNI